MDRRIRARSAIIDRWTNRLEALGRMKEADLMQSGMIESPLFLRVITAPSLGNGRLGYYDPLSEAIVISEEILSDTDAKTIENIFLHELAHALDKRLEGIPTGHSGSFRRCCAILGVDPGFDKSRARIDARKQHDAKERIRKLMALSSSPFENEASEAIKKARKLMIENSIGENEDERDEKIYTAELYEKKRFPFHIGLLARFIERNTGALIVVSAENGIKTLIAHGSVEQTEFSIYLFDYIISSSEDEIARLRRKGEKISRDSFISGAVSSLERRDEAEADDKAIEAIHSRNRALAEKIIYKTGLKARHIHSRGGDRTSFSKGESFGKDLNIPEGIGTRKIESK